MKLKETYYAAFFPLLILIFIISPAYSQQALSGQGRYGGTLRIAISKDFKSLDARYLSKSGSSTRGQQQLYNRMVEYGAKGTSDYMPGLATDWKNIDDVTWLVSLRQGVKFHNGKEMTAHDVAKNYDWFLNRKKYTQERGWRPPRGRNDIVQIKDVVAVDKYTLKYTLKFPFAPFAGINLGWALRGISDPDVVDKYGKQTTLNPVGTGPFKFVKYVSGSHLIIERFDDYWGGKPYLDRVLFRIIPDVQTRMIALQKGEVDIATDLLLSQMRALEKDPKLSYHLITEARRGSWGNLWFNLRRWPVNQLKFRQAVAMGADWKYISRAIFPKGMNPHPTRYTLYERSWAENPEAKKLIPAYNPDKARQLFKEVEKEAGKPLPRLYAGTNTGHQGLPGAALRIGAEQLAKIGLNLNVKILPTEVNKDIYRRDPKCSWDLMITSFVGPGIDLGETVGDFYSKTPNAGDGKNIPGYHNPRIDELYLTGGGSYDQEERKKIYQEMEMIILKDLVLLPLFDIPYVTGYNKKVHDFPAHDSAHPIFFSRWNNVWLEKR